jgi:drug/metabolite transporter (DMT)-like permease
MVYIALAILASGVIPVLFRGCDSWRVNLFWAIPINYLTCVAVGYFLSGHLFAVGDIARQPWIGLAVIQGILLAVNFFLLARTAQRAGVAIAALASRLSVAVPSVTAFMLYGDSLTPVKMFGLAAALVALFLCTAPEKASDGLRSKLFQILPLLVFVTFGCYFTILKYLQSYYLDSSTYHAYVTSAFAFGFVSSLAIGFGGGVLSMTDFCMRHLAAGLGLGAINYVAMYSLLRMLALTGWQSSQLYPIYSVGVVAVSTVLAFFCFRERLSRQKIIGLLVGVLAVALLNR